MALRHCLFLAALVFAPGCAQAEQPSPPRVNGQRALEHVRALVKAGPRVPGSPGHRAAQDYILKELRQAGAQVEEVDFVADTPLGKRPMKNILGKMAGRSADLIVVSGHYDTLVQEGFLGANDGGSSAALLLELARVLARGQRAATEVWVVFFDGEEAFRRWSPTDGLYGSRYQASIWQRDGVLSRIKALINVDMIGDKNLALKRDSNSTAWLTDLIWKVAQEKGFETHFVEGAMAVEDDHMPFIRAGVAAVDLIDFDYGPQNRYWHTPQDTPDKLSPRSLETVGEVVLETVRRLGQRWPSP
ncbi:MAG: M28 family peptidase [Candidatus Acidiferrales bacterium]